MNKFDKLKQPTIVAFGRPPLQKKFRIYITEILGKEGVVKDKDNKTTYSMQVEDYSGSMSGLGLKKIFAGALKEKGGQVGTVGVNVNKVGRPRKEIQPRNMVDAERSNHSWTSEEDAVLKKEIKDKGANYKTYEIVAEIVGRSFRAVHTRVLKQGWNKKSQKESRKVGSRQHKSWTLTQDNLLTRRVIKGGKNRENYERIATELKRSVPSIINRITILKKKGINSSPIKQSQKVRWTEEEDNIILKNMNLSPAQIRKQFLPHRKNNSIASRRWVLKTKNNKNDKDLVQVWHEEGQNPNIHIKGDNNG